MLPTPFSALIDASTSVLLTLSLRIPIIAFLAKTMTEVERIDNVNYPNYLTKFPLEHADPYTYPEWTWNPKLRQFVPTPKGVLTDRLHWYSALAIKKSHALFEIIHSITTARSAVWSGLIMQENIYMAKRIQAQRYKDKKYPKDELSYPYVLQYAELSGLTMRDAADEILFKAKLDDNVLSHTEYMRMKYFNMVKDAQDMDEVEVLIHDFRRKV